MTPGEVVRAIESKNRLVKAEAREKATFDYIQATLIIKGVSNCLGDKSAFPSIEEAYPSIFEEVIEEHKEKLQEQKMKLSALRFRQFAQSYNNNLKNKEVPKQINE